MTFWTLGIVAVIVGAGAIAREHTLLAAAGFALLGTVVSFFAPTLAIMAGLSVTAHLLIVKPWRRAMRND